MLAVRSIFHLFVEHSLEETPLHSFEDCRVFGEGTVFLLCVGTVLSTMEP